MAIEISPLFFDHFGFVIWIFLGFVALKGLRNKKIERWPRYILLSIAIIGILLDGLLLIAYYLEWEIINYAWIFDYLGIPTFLYLFWFARMEIKDRNIKSKVIPWILFILSIAGFIADVAMIIINT